MLLKDIFENTSWYEWRPIKPDKNVTCSNCGYTIEGVYMWNRETSEQFSRRLCFTCFPTIVNNMWRQHA